MKKISETSKFKEDMRRDILLFEDKYGKGVMYVTQDGKKHYKKEFTK